MAMNNINNYQSNFINKQKFSNADTDCKDNDEMMEQLTGNSKYDYNPEPTPLQSKYQIKQNIADDYKQNDLYITPENEVNKKINDRKLLYTLKTLDLENLFNSFNIQCITFNDIFLLSKEDLIEMNVPIGPRNRILFFAEEYKNFANNYTIDELFEFFNTHKQFVINQVEDFSLNANRNSSRNILMPMLPSNNEYTSKILEYNTNSNELNDNFNTNYKTNIKNDNLDDLIINAKPSVNQKNSNNCFYLDNNNNMSISNMQNYCQNSNSNFSTASLTEYFSNNKNTGNKSFSNSKNNISIESINLKSSKNSSDKKYSSNIKVNGYLELNNSTRSFTENNSNINMALNSNKHKRNNSLKMTENKKKSINNNIPYPKNKANSKSNSSFTTKNKTSKNNIKEEFYLNKDNTAVNQSNYSNISNIKVIQNNTKIIDNFESLFSEVENFQKQYQNMKIKNDKRNSKINHLLGKPTPNISELKQQKILEDDFTNEELRKFFDNDIKNISASNKCINDFMNIK